MSLKSQKNVPNEVVVAVELAAVLETARPCENARHRIGARLAALLMLAIVTRHGAMGRLGLDRLAVGTHEHRGHETERAVALCDHVRLHVAVVVLARPHEAALRLQHLRDHVVDETMLVPDLVLVEVRFVFSFFFVFCM